jgi:undecaprenyl-diphosphatase
MDYFLSVILGIIEGATEFLPISSTGHLLVASAFFNFPQFLAATPDAQLRFRDTFDIFIQIGAVFAVLVYYGRSLIQQAQKLPSDRSVQRFWVNILIAFVPAAVIGLLALKRIEETLAKPIPIAVALVLGGIAFLLIERSERKGSVHDIYQVTPLQALGVGAAQVASLIPGVSRSGASIVGGMLVGMDRLTATTFSFYLFIPTLGAATLYKLYQALRDKEVAAAQLPLFAIGAVVSFIVAYLSIVWLLRYVSTHSFRAFGVYRIVAGVAILALALFTTLLAH